MNDREELEYLELRAKSAATELEQALEEAEAMQQKITTARVKHTFWTHRRNELKAALEGMGVKA